MPRKAAVSHETTIQHILEVQGLVKQDGTILGPADQLWTTIASSLGDKLKPKYLYVFFHGNRYECRNRYCEKWGISTVNINRATSAASDETSDTEDAETSNAPMGTFPVKISASVWDEFFKPVSKVYPVSGKRYTRTVKVLPAYKWEDKLVELIVAQHKLPCPYSFQHSYVFTSHDPDQYIRIEAACNECGAQAEGKVYSEPMPGKEVKLIWTAPNTKDVPHSNKRHLTREKRSAMGNDLVSGSSVEYRKKLASQCMDMGDLESPLLYKTHVLRKCKQEARHKAVSAVKGRGVDGNLREMKASEPHAGSIHDIGSDPFYVHYFSQQQLQVYKNHCHDKDAVLCIDATGGVVSKVRNGRGQSKHVFLYEGVIRTDTYQLPVLQMLSQKHDSGSIMTWLNEWLRRGAPLPKEVVMDDSSALKSATARALAGCADVADYKSRLLDLLQGKEARLPRCFLRLDVNHLLNNAAKWDLWKSPEAKRLKQFYLHSLGLLIKATTLQDFLSILEKVLIVSGSTHEGNAESNFFQAQDYLTNLIKDNSDLPQQDEDQDLSCDDCDCDEDCDSVEEDDTCEQTSNLIKQVDLKATFKVCSSGNLSPYYSPTVREKFVKMSGDFVLWSAVCVSLFTTPRHRPKLIATSAYVESDFSNIKRNILRGISGTLQADTFVATHLTSIRGACFITGAQQRSDMHGSHSDEQDRNEEDRDVRQEGQENEDELTSEFEAEHVSDVAPKDLRNTENWMGEGVLPKRRKKRSIYLNSNPHLATALVNNQLKAPKHRLLINGNLLPSHEIEAGSHVFVVNTCTYDVLCHIAAQCYIDCSNFRTVVDEASCGLYPVSKSLAVNGAGKETYKRRARHISEAMEPTGECNTVKRSRKRSIVQMSYDCWGTIEEVGMKVLKENPSALLEWECSEGCARKDTLIMLPADPATLDTPNGLKLEDLAKAVENAIGISLYEDETIAPLHTCKNGEAETFTTKSCNYAPLLWINTDFFSTIDASNIAFSRIPLTSFPAHIHLSGKRFRLTGMVVKQPPNHYVALCKGMDNRWEQFDDLQRYPQSVSPLAQVSPVCLSYLQSDL